MPPIHPRPTELGSCTAPLGPPAWSVELYGELEGVLLGVLRAWGDVSLLTPLKRPHLQGTGLRGLWMGAHRPPQMGMFAHTPLPTEPGRKVQDDRVKVSVV